MAKEEEATCYVCCGIEGDGIFCSCTKCSNYYHLECYVPSLKKAPSVDRECLLCRDKEYFDELPNERTSSSGNMTKRELHLSRRLLLELYGVEDAKTGKRASKPFAKLSILQFKAYKMFIKRPIALDVIKDRLDKEHPNQYRTMKEVVHDFRRMFINCRTFWGMNNMPHTNSLQSGTIFTKYASLMEKTLDAKLEELAPDFYPKSKHDKSADKKRNTASKPKEYKPMQQRTIFEKTHRSRDDDDYDTSSSEKGNSMHNGKRKIEKSKKYAEEKDDSDYETSSYEKERKSTKSKYSSEIGRPKKVREERSDSDSETSKNKNKRKINTTKKKTRDEEEQDSDILKDSDEEEELKNKTKKLREEDLNGRLFKNGKTDENSTSSSNHTAGKDKAKVESTFNGQESSKDSPNKKKSESDERKTNDSVNGDNEDKKNDLVININKQYQEINGKQEVNGKEEHKKTEPGKVNELWDPTKDLKTLMGSKNLPTTNMNAHLNDIAMKVAMSGKINENSGNKPNGILTLDSLKPKSNEQKENVERMAQLIPNANNFMGSTRQN